MPDRNPTARDNLRGQKSLGPLKMSLEMAHKVILPPKKNYIPQFLKQRDINSYYPPVRDYEFGIRTSFAPALYLVRDYSALNVAAFFHYGTLAKFLDKD